MIAEITVNKSEQAPGSVSLAPKLTGLDFIADTANRINKMPLTELESRLPEFVERCNQNAFVLGGVLERIRREKFWNPGSKRAQNALFERWVEDTCHYSGRKARYLISVYLGLLEAAIPSAKISSIGWSKLRMIAPLLKPTGGAEDAGAASENEAHNEELLKLARTKSRKSLEAALRREALGHDMVAPSHRTATVRRRYVFEVARDQTHVVDAALAKIERQTGQTGGAALVELAKVVNGRSTLSDTLSDAESKHRRRIRSRSESPSAETRLIDDVNVLAMESQRKSEAPRIVR